MNILGAILKVAMWWMVIGCGWSVGLWKRVAGYWVVIKSKWLMPK